MLRLLACALRRWRTPSGGNILKHDPANRVPYTDAVNSLRNVMGTAFLVMMLCPFGLAGSQPPMPSLRWTAGTGNCTFREGDDGRSYYGLASGDFELTLVVDRQELEKI